MGSKNKKKKADAKEKLETMGELGGAISAYRPHQQQAMNQAMQQVLSMYQGSQNMMGSGYGQAGINGSQYGNIVSPEMMSIGLTSKAPGFGQGPSMYAGSGQTGPSLSPASAARQGTNDRGEAKAPGDTTRTFY